MARTLTTIDACAIMTELVKEATGQSAIDAINTNNFVSAGELVISTGMENVFNALNLVLGRTIVSVKPYNAKLSLMEEVDNNLFTSRVRKISFYAKDPKNSGAFNTNLYTNLAEGFTDGQNLDDDGDPQSTKSMWEQNPAMPLEMNFGGQSTWQYCRTDYEVQIQQAFRSPEEFAAFVEGYMVEAGNDIQSQREAWNRMVLLNKIGSIVNMSDDMPASVINLTALYNQKFGTNYTSAQLRSTYLESFLPFYVSMFKMVAGYMSERSTNYHWSVPKTVGSNTFHILRHTPMEDLRAYLFEPLFKEAEALVLPQIFNPQYLDIKTQYEPINYWQSEINRSSVKVTPAIVDTDPDSATYGTQIEGSAVNLPYVVGLLCDKAAMATNFKLERVATSPLEARKLYRNTWSTFLRGNLSDPTENAVLFIMDDTIEIDPVLTGGSRLGIN